VLIDPKLVGKRTELNFKARDRIAIMMRTFSLAEFGRRGADEKRMTLAHATGLGQIAIVKPVLADGPDR
jgi:hypothetical protein